MSDSANALPSFRVLIYEFLKSTFDPLPVTIYWDRLTPSSTCVESQEGYIFVNQRPCGRLTPDLHFVHHHITDDDAHHANTNFTYNISAADPSFFPQLVDSIRRTLSSPPNVVEDIDREVIEAWTRSINQI